MMTGRPTGPRRLTLAASLSLAALLTACACRPDAQLHQQPAGLSRLPESLLVGIACREILPPSRDPPATARAQTVSPAREQRPQRPGLGTWNAYVERGPSLEERRRRLAEVPDHWREQVRRHVACYFRLRAQTHRDRST